MTEAERIKELTLQNEELTKKLAEKPVSAINKAQEEIGNAMKKLTELDFTKIAGPLALMQPKKMDEFSVNGSTCKVTLTEGGAVTIQFPDLIHSESFYNQLKSA